MQTLLFPTVCVYVQRHLHKFGVRRHVVGDGFRAEYENLLETHVATARITWRF